MKIQKLTYIFVPTSMLQASAYVAKKSIKVGDARMYSAWEVEERNRQIIQRLNEILNKTVETSFDSIVVRRAMIKKLVRELK